MNIWELVLKKWKSGCENHAKKCIKHIKSSRRKLSSSREKTDGCYDNNSTNSGVLHFAEKLVLCQTRPLPPFLGPYFLHNHPIWGMPNFLNPYFWSKSKKSSTLCFVPGHMLALAVRLNFILLSGRTTGQKMDVAGEGGRERSKKCALVHERQWTDKRRYQTCGPWIVIFAGSIIPTSLAIGRM